MQGQGPLYDAGKVISREEVVQCIEDNAGVIEFLLDFEKGIFTLTLEEYTLFPAPFFRYRQYLGEFRDEVRKAEQKKRDQLNAHK